MQNFKVTVNGKVFEVTVEEAGQGGSAPVQAGPVAVVEKAVSPVTPAVINTDETSIEAPLSGTILSVKVKAGDAVKAGQVLLTLEALKMENEIVAPAAGVVKGVFVQNGATVNVGDVMLTLGSI